MPPGSLVQRQLLSLKQQKHHHYICVPDQNCLLVHFVVWVPHTVLMSHGSFCVDYPHNTMACVCSLSILSTDTTLKASKFNSFDSRLLC